MDKPTTQDAIEAKVLADYVEVKNRVLSVYCLQGYSGCHSVDFMLETPAVVRVIQTAPDSLLRWQDDWCDPYWDLDLVCPHPELKTARSFWMSGHSYELGTGRCQRSSFEITPWPQRLGINLRTLGGLLRPSYDY
jgi:hypothetical protein